MKYSLISSRKYYNTVIALWNSLVWLSVCCLYKEVYLQIFKYLSFYYTAVAESGKVGPINQTRWVAVVTPTDLPKSVCNRCIIDFLCYMYHFAFFHACWYRGFYQQTEADPILFLLMPSSCNGGQSLLMNDVCILHVIRTSKINARAIIVV